MKLNFNFWANGPYKDLLRNVWGQPTLQKHNILQSNFGVIDEQVLVPLADKLTYNTGKMSCYKWDNLRREQDIFNQYYGFI